ncbi:hypothetical protein SBOR_4688 [Sclerotinia borealis F-4128]|uniref:BTB domain-containing protein n=1 Tax=Sclerotinia borealis (strain F-4128) TaxID=1432307 RepID=W9CGB5_SCLBF|nr:hypothetical protein SBOR_4688 [Sclerotinia borealis F-4128]
MESQTQNLETRWSSTASNKTVSFNTGCNAEDYLLEDSGYGSEIMNLFDGEHPKTGGLREGKEFVGIDINGESDGNHSFMKDFLFRRIPNLLDIISETNNESFIKLGTRTSDFQIDGLRLKSFDSILYWIFHDKMPPNLPQPSEHGWDPALLWYFAAELELPELQDLIMDAWRRVESKPGMVEDPAVYYLYVQKNFDAGPQGDYLQARLQSLRTNMRSKVFTYKELVRSLGEKKERTASSHTASCQLRISDAEDKFVSVRST